MYNNILYLTCFECRITIHSFHCIRWNCTIQNTVTCNTLNSSYFEVFWAFSASGKHRNDIPISITNNNMDLWKKSLLHLTYYIYIWHHRDLSNFVNILLLSCFIRVWECYILLYLLYMSISPDAFGCDQTTMWSQVTLEHVITLITLVIFFYVQTKSLI